MYDLLTAAPHMPPRLMLEPRELEAYHRGYYMALDMALKVMEHAEARWSIYLRSRRLEARRRRSPAGQE